MVTPTKSLASLALALLLAGCASFELKQTSRFMDEDGRFVTVDYGVGKEDHVNTFVSPANGETLEFKSKLRVKVEMPDGERFFAFQCMNFTGHGTMYRTDDNEWVYLAAGFTCEVYRYEEKARDHRLVFAGAVCQAPYKPKEKENTSYHREYKIRK